MAKQLLIDAGFDGYVEFLFETGAAHPFNIETIIEILYFSQDNFDDQWRQDLFEHIRKIVCVLRKQQQSSVGVAREQWLCTTFPNLDEFLRGYSDEVGCTISFGSS